MKQNWKTWAPFQSPKVREICEHMTEAERRKATMHGILYGLWVAASLAVPLFVAAAFGHPLVALIAVPLFIASIPVWRNTQRSFLCSTAWAREKSFTPERL